MSIKSILVMFKGEGSVRKALDAALSNASSLGLFRATRRVSALDGFARTVVFAWDGSPMILRRRSGMQTPTPKRFRFERNAGGQGRDHGFIRISVPDAQCDHAEPAPFYATNKDLPADVREALPAVAQTLYREAYNHACGRRAAAVLRGLDRQHDESAKRAAWAAVRRLYVQRRRSWVRRKPS